jgi:hypothetical protein
MGRSGPLERSVGNASIQTGGLRGLRDSPICRVTRSGSFKSGFKDHHFEKPSVQTKITLPSQLARTVSGSSWITERSLWCVTWMSREPSQYLYSTTMASDDLFEVLEIVGAS